MQTQPKKKPHHAGHGNHLRNPSTVKAKSLAKRLEILDALTSEGVVVRGRIPMGVRS